MNNRSKYIKAFFAEAEENLQNMNKALLELEKDPGKREFIDEMFRHAHTIKGGAASMNYEEISMLAHEMESLMDRLRSQNIEPDSSVIEILFETFDLLEALIGNAARKKKEKFEITPHIDRLKAISCATPFLKPGIAKEGQAVKVTTLIRPQTVRVDIGHLDKLMNLVGELVIDKIRLSRIGSIHEIPELTEIIAHLDRLITDVQDEVMQARLVPVDMIFNRFPRMVRDLAKAGNKKIKLIVKGTEIEVDRTILDKISDPMIHLLRNAVAHGIEPAVERIKAGKPETGRIELTASREKEHVVLEISDDGRGINSDRVLDMAIKKGIITLEKGVKLNNKEKLMLICAPGLSTSEETTDVSGRGVGMDVVKTTLESIDGTVDINSDKKSGTKVTLKLPLSLAIARGLLFMVQEETFIVPLANVQTIIRIRADDIKTIKGHEAISLRGDVVPIIRLAKILDLSSNEDPKSEFDALVVRIGGKRAGLVVDCLLGQQEIVIKPLDGYLKGVKGYAGATILGDGKVAFILDVASLIV